MPMDLSVDKFKYLGSRKADDGRYLRLIKNPELE